jgi:tRNA(fMet)-specific endonuclease VapC
MSGNRYFLDTNSIIQLLKANKQLLGILKNADYIGISVISRLEFFVFS